MKHLERLVVGLAVVMLAGMLALGNARSVEEPASGPLVRPAAVATGTPRSQARSEGKDSYTGSQPAMSVASGRHLRPEQIVILPRQIQDQVAATLLTTAPLLSEAEILTLPAPIQDQLRQAHQTAIP